MPYLMEAMILLEEGNLPAAIDKIAIDFGMPMGPIALADKVGLDVCLSVAENLIQYFGGAVPERLKAMVKSGKLGVKSGEGFYAYKNGKKIKTTKPEKIDLPSKISDMTDRLILRMLNESVACLAENVISNADLLDAGMIFGTGFAPFRGGPIQYAKTRGINVIVSRLEALTRKYGQRFMPQDGWKNLTLNNNSSSMDEAGFVNTEQRSQDHQMGAEAH
ncbi:MAG: enoyl CoA hydratase [uncultured bacterium]|nr:MAG: enoyl CoA hydratase [uncultured bacterium]